MTNGHKHQSLVDGRAAEAARYPQALCQALVRGPDRQPALCILTVWVKSQRAWKFLEDQDVLLSKNGRHYLKKPVHEYEYFIDERGNRDLCYMATVKGIFPDAN